MIFLHEITTHFLKDVLVASFDLFSEDKDIEREPFSLPQTPITKEKRVRKSDPITGGEMVWLLFALIVIMGLFFAMNYIKFRNIRTF